MNCVALTGYLVRDPEVYTAADGKPFCVLRIAVRRMAAGGKAGYIDVLVFDKSAEACATHLTKGRLVAVDGRLSLSRDRGSAGTHCVVGSVEFLGRPARGPAESIPEATS